MLIYIVEDDTDIRELESYAMKSSGYEVQSFGESKSFFKACTAEIPQLVILDVMLPDFDGLSVLEKMRRDAVTKNVPVILVTAKGSEMDKVKGLDMGADDYITKPFSVLELISRVRAILRRCSVDDRQDVIKLGQIVFDDSKHIVTSCGEECNLTFKEYELLKYLLKNKGMALTRENIILNVWGYDFEGESRTVDMHITTLRQKLGSCGNLIKTVRNVGYKAGNKVKLSKKLLKNFSVIAVVSILLTAVFSTAAFWFVFSDEQEAEVRQYTDKIISVYNSDSEIDLSKYYGIGDFRVTLIKSDGSVVSDSVDTDVSSMPNHSDRPEFEQAIKDGNGSSHRMSETLNKITYYYAEKTADGSVIRVAKTIDSIYGIFLFVIPSILIIMIGVFVVCTILAKRSTKKIIEPIKEMADNGNGSPYDELLPLSQKIASQQRQIKRQMRRLQFEKDKISTLIENMAEGFILIDVDKKVLMSNYSASKLLGADDDGVTDKTLIAFSRNVGS